MQGQYIKNFLSFQFTIDNRNVTDKKKKTGDLVLFHACIQRGSGWIIDVVLGLLFNSYTASGSSAPERDGRPML